MFYSVSSCEFCIDTLSLLFLLLVFFFQCYGDHRDLHYPLRRQRQMCIRDRLRMWNMPFNFMNFIVLVLKIVEIFSIATLAFAPYINWGFSQTVLNFLNSTNGEISQDQYEILQINFWVAIGLILGLIFLLFIAMHRVSNKLYGTKPGFSFIFDAILIYFFIMLSQTFHIFIMKSLINAYSCNYQRLPWRLYADKAMQCFGEQHRDYLFGTGFALLAYFPIITFFYPNFQFYNSVLTLKYERGWIILNSSIKFIIIGFTTFFKTPDGITISLISCTFLLFITAIIFLIYEPCHYQIINRFETGGYFIIFWCFFSSLLLHTTTNQSLSLIILLIGLFVITVTILQGTIHEHYNDLRLVSEERTNTEDDLRKQLFIGQKFNKIVKTQEDDVLEYYVKKKQEKGNNGNTDVIRCNTEDKLKNVKVSNQFGTSFIQKIGSFSSLFKRQQDRKQFNISKKAAIVCKEI
eukprot:TRINITY_DN1314_c0_g1_i1.p1 TRINITY_DN1314_c0_g1~~TRINITY_DN1314_c0_g1_i1.p1  ORF type:complete len:463 (+),score=24.23 TRINITY_DN1314_c0_g1_i1:27-1415(+)